MKSKTIILLILFITSGIFYYQLTSSNSIEKLKVKRIIDGDTIELQSSEILRLKGINTPEKSYPFYEEAKQFLNKTLTNKEIKIEKIETDKYGRTISYIFLNNQNINEQILKQGLGNLYYYEKDQYYNDLEKAEKFARENELGIWKKSPNSNCIKIIELKYKESPKRCSNDEKLTIQNLCNYEIELTIKDDATHTYKEKIEPNSILTKSFSCIWNDDGDTVYLSDNQGLIKFYRY